MAVLQGKLPRKRVMRGKIVVFPFRLIRRGWRGIFYIVHLRREQAPALRYRLLRVRRGRASPTVRCVICGRGNPAPTVTFEVGTHPRLPCLKGGGKTVGFDGGIVCGRPMVAPTIPPIACV